MSEVKRIAVIVPLGDSRPEKLAPLARVVGAGFSCEPWELAQPLAFVTEVDRTVAGLLYAEAAVRAEEAGCAAAVINSVCDYGIGAARSVCSIPVVGGGEAGIKVALGIGRSFGIVTVWPPRMLAGYERVLADSGSGPRCAGVRCATSDDELATNLTESFPEKLAGRSGPVMDRIEQAARESIRIDGADVLVLGCMCMVAIRGELERRVGVPVVDPMVAAYEHAELLAGTEYTPTAPYDVERQRAYLRTVVTSAPWPTDGTGECGDACEVLSAIPADAQELVHR